MNWHQPPQGPPPGYPGGFPPRYKGPHAPPQPLPPPEPRRPATVEAAFYASSVYWVLFFLINYDPNRLPDHLKRDLLSTIMQPVATLLVAALLVYVAWRMRRGSNTVRVVFTALVGVTVLASPVRFVGASAIEAAQIAVVMVALPVAALICLWVPASNRYFSAHKYRLEWLRRPMYPHR